MRVLVLAEAIAGLGARETGATVGRAWADHGHQVAVVPLAAAGGDVAGAVDDLMGDRSGIVVIQAVADPDGSAGLGRTVRGLLDREPRPEAIWLDLDRAGVSDLGVGLVLSLAGQSGDTSELTPQTVLAARSRLGATRLLAVVPESDAGAELTGMRGLASLAAAAARDAGEPTVPIADLLAEDESRAALARAMGFAEPPRGAGAASGLGLAVLALGGSVASAPGALGEVARLGRTVDQADLVVVVADAIDFGDAGGEVVAAARSWAEAASLPCIAVCGAVRISVRELRTLGIEAAYGLDPRAELTVDSLGQLARQVAGTWSWGTRNEQGRPDVVPHVD
jgi:glycerate kinase